MTPSILLIGSGDGQYREYVCEAIARTYGLFLLESCPATWQRPYLARAVQVSLDDTDAVLAAARELRVDGVLTYDEMRVELAARIAAELGIPHLDAGAARRCRDKLETRRALSRAGVPSARANHVFSFDEAQRAARDVGFPCVLKPRALAGSIGVTLVDGPEDLAAAFELAGEARYGSVDPPAGVLVEEYLSGPEVSVDSVVLGGRVAPVTMARKRLGFTPYFEETGHVVTSEPIPNDVRQVVVAAHRALGIDCGVTHAELRLTPTGPRIVEVNARLGGDLIPYLGWLATGVDLPRAAADVAVGVWPDLEPTRARAAAVRFFYPEQSGRVVALGIDAGPADHVDRLEFEAAPGDVLQLPPDGFLSRLGFAIVTGASERECEARLDDVERRLRISTAPLTSAVAEVAA